MWIFHVFNGRIFRGKMPFTMAMTVAHSRNSSCYDHLIKLLLVGDSGVGKSRLLLRFVDDSFSTSFIPTVGIDSKLKNIEVDKKILGLQIWDTAGQERFKTITDAYYRGAMGIILVYDITNQATFENVRNWICSIEEHATNTVDKVLVGNKTDLSETQRAVPKALGQSLADEYGIKFFETSAKTNLNVEEVFYSIGRDIKKRLEETETKADQNTITLNKTDSLHDPRMSEQRSKCCFS